MLATLFLVAFVVVLLYLGREIFIPCLSGSLPIT